jgi:hypothetical protein
MAVKKQQEVRDGLEFFVHEPTGDPTGRVYIRYSDVVAITIEKSTNRHDHPYKANVLLRGGHSLYKGTQTLERALQFANMLAEGNKVGNKAEGGAR